VCCTAYTIKRRYTVECAAIVLVLLSALPATAQTAPTITPAQIRLIEWNLPAQGDATPGAIIVDTMGDDTNRMWFVTRSVQPNLYRVDFPRSLMKGAANWMSWQLNAFTTGGLRRVHASRDRRSIFIRTLSSTLGEAVERVDTDPTKCPGPNCQTTIYRDNVFTGFDVSDVAVDDINNVFTTHTPDNLTPALSYVQRLTPGATSATVTRWFIQGSGAGLCGFTAPPDTSANTPCISGIAVHPYKRNLIYFSEPTANSISELNIGTNPPTIRRWSLDDLTAACVPSATILCNAIFGPRQLLIDRREKVWVVTGSGDLVSLQPSTSRMTIHELPDNVAADPFSVAPDDDAVGYTSSMTSKVGMLLPKGQPHFIQATPAAVFKVAVDNLPADTQPSVCNSGLVSPIGKTVDGQVTTKDDGTFIEAFINTGFDDNGNPSDSTNPLGITPVKAKAQGTFFFAVGNNASVAPLIDRVGFVRLPIREKIRFPRDDDDENDGSDRPPTWHAWHGHPANGDDDDDGIDNAHDNRAAQERNVQQNDTTVYDGVLAGGASKDYSIVTTSTSLAIEALTTADDPLAQIEIRILNSLGVVIAKSLPTPGLATVEVLMPAAGTYTCRIINYGANPVIQTPNLFVRELWIP
jgi:hypothetical protein